MLPLSNRKEKCWEKSVSWNWKSFPVSIRTWKFVNSNLNLQRLHNFIIRFRIIKQQQQQKFPDEHIVSLKIDCLYFITYIFTYIFLIPFRSRLYQMNQQGLICIQENWSCRATNFICYHKSVRKIILMQIINSVIIWFIFSKRKDDLSTLTISVNSNSKETWKQCWARSENFWK